MLNSKTKCFLICICLLSVFLPSCASKGAGRLYLKPTPVENKSYNIQDQTITFRDKKVSIIVGFQSQEMIDEFYLSRYSLNPFSITSSGESIFTIFSVLIKNESDKRITFNPMRVSIYDDNEDLFVPFDYSDFYMIFAEEDNSFQKLDIVKKTILETSITIYPGKEKEGFLIFSNMSEDAEKINLILYDFYIGFEAQDVLFIFDVEKIEQKN